MKTIQKKLAILMLILLCGFCCSNTFTVVAADEKVSEAVDDKHDMYDFNPLWFVVGIASGSLITGGVSIAMSVKRIKHKN